MGDQWLKRVTKHAANVGKKTRIEDQPGHNSVCGVGGASNAVRSKATVPIGVPGNLMYKGS
eukprot:5672356-Prorocentrum_lima.AAC.1